MRKVICPACIAEEDPSPQEVKSRGLCPKHYQRASRAGVFGGTKEICPFCVAEKLPDIREVYTRGMCRRHYLRKRKSGEIGTVYTSGGASSLCTACLEAGEERPAHSRGLCGAHYGRAYRGSDTSTPIRKTKPSECSFDPCDNPAHSGRGDLCAGHYSQKRRGKTLTPLRSYRKNDGPCEVTSHRCPNEARHDGLCNRHYQRRLAEEAD